MNRQSLTRGIAAALALLMLVPAFAMAEADQTEGGFRGMMSSTGMPYVDEAGLTADQLAVYQQAKADYEAVEDQQLTNLVTAGSITIEEANEYVEQRNEPRQMPTGERRQRPEGADIPQMSEEQRQAIADAMNADDREAAIADLIAQGIIDEQMVAGMQSRSQRDFSQMDVSQMGLWMRVQMMAEQDLAASIAVNNIGVAAQMMRDTLSAAGIETPNRGQWSRAEEAPIE